MIMLHMPSVRDRHRRNSLGQVSGAAAIHDAVVKGKIHLAKFILDAVDSHTVVNSRDAHGKTPLIRAVRIDEPAVRAKAVDLLVKYQADVNLVDNVGRTALSYACEHHCNDVIQKLVKNNVDPNLQDKNGNTPLMYCAMSDNAPGIEILSKSFRRLGLDVDKMNAEGMTPLIVAAKNGFSECAQLLAQKAKACLYTRDNVRNMNAIEWAREGGCSSPDMEAIQTRPRTRSQLASHCDTAELLDSSRLLPRRGSITPNRNKEAEYSSMTLFPSGDPGGNGESNSKSTNTVTVGCHLNNPSLQADKHCTHLSLEELSKKFRGLGVRSSSEDTECPRYVYADSQSLETPDDELTFKQYSNFSESQPTLSIDTIPEPPSHNEERRTAGVFFNKQVHHPSGINHPRRRPMSANVTNCHIDSFSKSFDSVLTTRLSNSIDNLQLLTVTHPLVPHPPTTAREVSNLSKLSHLSRSMEVIENQRASSEQKHVGSSSTSYVDLHEISGKRKTGGPASLSPGDLSSFYTRPESGQNRQDLGHLPSLSPRCVPREI